MNSNINAVITVPIMSLNPHNGPIQPAWDPFLEWGNWVVKRLINHQGHTGIKWKIRYLLSELTNAAAAKSRQSCRTLCDPIDGSPSGSPVPGILQARTPEWIAISFSNAWKWKVKVKSLSRLWLFVTPWTAAHQAPLSMGFSRQEYWSGGPVPSLPPMLDSTFNHRC